MPNAGRMRVLLTVHGGTRALEHVMEGLVRRNERSIRERAVPSDLPRDRISYDGAPVWRDAVSVLADGVASAGSIAAWVAAERRARHEGDPRAGSVVIVEGVPKVAVQVGGTSRHPAFRYSDPAESLRPAGIVHGIVGATADCCRGRITEYLNLTLDDDKALPVREFGDAIARHNARRIVEKRLPELYTSGVRYQTEGRPEKWWDAEEILLNRHDDCEGLAAYRAGELIVRGLDAGVLPRRIEAPAPEMGGEGGRLFHAVTWVRRPDGGVAFDDPSARLGMEVPAFYLDYARKQRAAGRSL